MTLAQAQLLLTVLLPLPPLSLEQVIDIIHYYQRRQAAATACHRQRTEAWIVNRHDPIGPNYRIIGPPVRA